MPENPSDLQKYEKVLDGIQFPIACCLDGIEKETQAAAIDLPRPDTLRARLGELKAAERRLRINTDSVTLPICEKYGAQVRARLAEDALNARR